MTADVRTHPEGDLTGADSKDPHPEPASPPAPEAPGEWTAVCALEKLQPERGVAALVAGEPVAVFRTHPSSSHGDRLFALHNVDPFSRASVLSRGIVGDLGGTPVVASPLFKQHFSLESGVAIENPDVAVATYRVRVHDGTVEVGDP